MRWCHALVAAVLADLTVDAWHVHHTQYHIDIIAHSVSVINNYLGNDVILMIKVIVASIGFGLAGMLFAKTAHAIKNFFIKIFQHQWMIPIIGGLMIIGLTFLIGIPDYLSLGIDPEYPGAVTIPSAFTHGGADTWSWLWKTIYTTLTLGTGFKGGEVTPLFYIGATLGNTLAETMNAPVSLFAAMGFIAVFAGATNTPLACTLMGVELFGGEHILFFGIACFTAYFFSGHSGIYSAQRIAIPKVLGRNSDPDKLT